MSKSTAAQSMTDSSPPPYPQEPTPTAFSSAHRLLRVGGWDIYHAGTTWPRERAEYTSFIESSILLALKPTASTSKPSKKISLIKLNVVGEDIIGHRGVPRALRSNPVKIERYEVMGHVSKEALTVGRNWASDEAMPLFLKIDHSYLDDHGVLYVRLDLNKPDSWTQGHTRFHFHLVGKKIGATRISHLWFKLFSRSVVSDRVDNDRTSEVAAATMPLPEDLRP